MTPHRRAFPCEGPDGAGLTAVSSPQKRREVRVPMHARVKGLVLSALLVLATAAPVQMMRQAAGAARAWWKSSAGAQGQTATAHGTPPPGASARGGKAGVDGAKSG